MKKACVYRAALAAAFTSFMITGCSGNAYPELSDDDYNKVVKYAAGMLMKYKLNTDDMLTYVDPEYTPPGTEEPLIDRGGASSSLVADAGEASSLPSPAGDAGTGESDAGALPAGEAQETDGSSTEAAGNTGGEQGGALVPGRPDGQGDSGALMPGRPGTQTASSSSEVSDTSLSAEGGSSAQDGSASSSQTDSSLQAQAPEAGSQDTSALDTAESGPLNEDTMQGETAAAAPDETTVDIGSSWLQQLATGIKVEYVGYSVKNVYPDADSQGAVSAKQGDRLLILDFDIRNTTDHAVTINTARQGPAYKLVINGNVQGFTLVTMIDNDLSSMNKELAPGQRMDTVMVMELPGEIARSVDTLDLRIMQGSEAQMVKLE